MPSLPSSLLDDKYSKGILLFAVLFFSWFLAVKNFVLDWTAQAQDSQQPSQPNILLIVVDDLGYDDTSAINAQGLPTPNIQELAQSGVTFRRHYADATCTPSRVAILTGRYPERSGFRAVGTEIPAEFTTIAQQLGAAGYATYLTGKWHAGEDRVEAWPQHKGFDHWFGFLNQWELAGEITQATVGALQPTYRNPRLRENGGELVQHKGHLTDILTEHTIARLQQLQTGGKPWFLYHAFLAPHQPIQPAPRYRQKFPDTPEGKYTALITQLDDSIGRILSVVDRENTLVIFVSDNGGTNRERNNNFPYFGKKGEMHEGAFRTPLIVSWPEVIRQPRFIDDVVMNVDIYPTVMAAAHAQTPEDVDGKNLWPTLLHDTPVEQRQRSWEIFSANINALSFSFLSSTGQWRLSSFQGLAPYLFDLSTTPSGEDGLQNDSSGVADELRAAYWQEHWRKSQVAASALPGTEQQQTLYQGFDAMRTPYRYGFAIGIEIGPLAPYRSEGNDSPTLLAGQKDVWALHYEPTQGLEWHIAGSILRDASFEPSRCNAIVMTGYFHHKGHLTKRDSDSLVKLYSGGLLRDADRAVASNPSSPVDFQNPTFVNFGGSAIFSNTMLSSFLDSYTPEISPQLMDVFTPTFRARQLSLADIAMMNSQLCKQSAATDGK